MVNSAQHYTLYVDGACRGNPGLGGWGALIIDAQNHTKELYAGDKKTTNNRMELTAAIEGIKACPLDAKLTIYTDSTYVLKGITEWIKGWKAKNWKDVKNVELWQQLDAVCQGRKIEWQWVKGHAGHEGNERADQLANLGADLVDKKKATKPVESLLPPHVIPQEHQQNTQQAPQNDWLLHDPLGLDGFDDADFDSDLNHDSDSDLKYDLDSDVDQALDLDQSFEDTTQQISSAAQAVDILKNQITPSHMNPHIHITQSTNPQQGERLLILDTETTGFYYQDGDRIIEVGAIEMINRRLTGSSIHVYINPQKAVGESENIHGISDDFLQDKPLFKDIAQVLFDYLNGAEIVAHNATFDMNFLDAEFDRVGLAKLSTVCQVTDTLALAKRKHPGQKNSLDALVKRYEIPARDRTFHGALLDAEILADVYLAMTGGQVRLDIDQHTTGQHDSAYLTLSQHDQAIDIPLILPQQKELEDHLHWMQQFQQKSAQPSIFEKLDFKS